MGKQQKDRRRSSAKTAGPWGRRVYLLRAFGIREWRSGLFEDSVESLAPDTAGWKIVSWPRAPGLLRFSLT